MPAVRKRGANQWQVQVRRKGWPKQSATFATYREAKRWGEEIENEMDRGVFVRRDLAERTTLAELIRGYVAEVVPQHKGAESERARCEMLCVTELGARAIASLRRRDFKNYVKERLKIRKPATVRRELQLLHAIIEWALEEEEIYLPGNPAKIKFPRFHNERNRRLGRDMVNRLHDEELRLLREAKATGRRRADNGTFSGGQTVVWWLRPLLILAVETAMRRGELLALKWRDINLKDRVAQLHTSKNGYPRRVPLSRRELVP